MEKTNASPLDTISMAVEMWLDFYNLFQKYVCVDSVLAVGGYIVFQKIEKGMEKNLWCSELALHRFRYISCQSTLTLPCSIQYTPTKIEPFTITTTAAPTF